ncbi:MAG TPA: hypothetical protein VM680_06230 [Verrucomicrobiae bacterium]|nr:hypothetical protein [Verrucomicrobiae bacterium]
MKTVCSLLFPIALLAGVVFIAVTLWTRTGVSVVHLDGATLHAAGGLSAAEVRDLVD